MQARFVADLFKAVGPLDETLADRAADRILAWPKTYGIDSILVPAITELAGLGAIRDLSAVQRLRTTCLEHLRARIAEPLEPPTDWRRESAVGCKCANCTDLSRFLGDPACKTWTLKAAESARSHVEDSIRKAQCDLDVTTDRRGRPYSLICTKNRASYDRRVRQRNEDLANLKRLEQ
jgi:hypothetical protein